MDFRKTFGELVREQRQANGLQLRELAQKAHLSYSYLSEVERGVKECHSATMNKIADGLGIDLYELIIEAGYRMAGNATFVPDTPESLYRGELWEKQYADLKG